MRTRIQRLGMAELAVLPALLAAALGACAPALDWRETRLEGAGAALLFPCRPERQVRVVHVGEAALPMQLHVCSAAGATFSLAVLDADAPARMTATLAALRAQTVANLDGVASAATSASIAGATPNPQSARLTIDGRRPDGRRVVAHAAFFVKGLRLYQASVVGPADAAPSDASETFFASIRLP